MYRDILGFSIAPFMQRVMVVNGFYASIMRTAKKSENSGTWLPPGVPIPVLPVDYLKVKPESWCLGANSYVCPVNSDWGLWFNFSMNNPENTAILPSIKGMNPLTGMRTEGYGLQEYRDECPIHKKHFSKGNLCEECGFKWPYQNYLSQGNAYIDGFRMPDGNVRQFYFTEDMAKSVPELVIGAEDTVPAFGFCFYKLKDFKRKWEDGERIKNKFPFNTTSQSSFIGGLSGMRGGTDHYFTGCAGSKSIRGYTMDSYHPEMYDKLGSSVVRESLDIAERSDFIMGITRSKTLSAEASTSESSLAESRCYFSSSASSDMITAYADTDRSYSEVLVRNSAEVGIGAGAKIKQGFAASKHAVEDWESKPAGVLRIYFVFQEEFEKYASAGFNNLEGNDSGYLEGIPVGGSHE